MIYLALPVGSSHGWGICGKYTAREMHALTQEKSDATRLITHDFNQETLGDELEYLALAPLAMKPAELQAATVNGPSGPRLNAPLLNSIVDKTNAPLLAMRGTRTVGYTFFEENLFQPDWIENARRHYDLIATGSTWCTDVLKAHGLANVETVLQGVDRRLFFPAPEGSPLAQREFLKDRFVIFSGGKFEYRKGQDLVIRAVKVMQDRHKDVVLVNSWYNLWQNSFDTMKLSPHLRMPTVSGNYFNVMSAILQHNGLDLSRVITLAPRNNALMARIYRNTDIGLFPNRCEGGTNLVLMEYMAIGKPVVASPTTGHADVVNTTNALPIAMEKEQPIPDLSIPGGKGPTVATWPEPNLDSIIAQLEEAYRHREQREALGKAAAQTILPLTWRKTAEGFYHLLTA
jgi:glycosyltransferase involved in cell wall biosynthesis